MKVAEVAREYGLPHTKVSTWKKQSDKIIQDAGKSTPKRKRLRWSPHIEVEQSLILWLREMHSLDVPPQITYMMPYVEHKPEPYAEPSPPQTYGTICSVYLESMFHLLSM